MRSSRFKTRLQFFPNPRKTQAPRFRALESETQKINRQGAKDAKKKGTEGYGAPKSEG